MDLLIYIKIASYHVDTYYSMLSIPTFARHVRANNYKFLERFKEEKIVRDTKYTFIKDKLHSFNDKPAIKKSGNKYWYRFGNRHRDNDLPAMVHNWGVKLWYQNDQKHRDNDLPAIEWPNGDKVWYQHDRLHRDNDLPARITNGKKEYFKHGIQNNYRQVS